MAMSYTQIEVSHELVRNEILSFLREVGKRLILCQPSSFTGANHIWFDTTKRAGMSVNDLVDKVYERLISSGAAKCVDVPVDDSTIMHAYDAYFPLKTKSAILEEIFELVRIGILIPVKPEPQDPGRTFHFKFGFTGLMLTEHGIRFLTEEPGVPYFVEQYLDGLRQTAEPDDELKAYLSEGLACLRNNLSRAAAILLRVSAEHTLNKLIESTTAAIKEKGKQQQFRRRIKAAGINIEERAEVTFKKLESSTILIPNTRHFRNMVSKRLRSAFHSIRDLGGTAAHLPSAIQLEEVRDHYTLYASSVYAITMKIIEHQKTK